MTEILNPNFTVSPDLGGTRFDYNYEVSRDKLRFFQRDGEIVTKIEIPTTKSFITVSRAEGNGDYFFKGFYRFTGKLASARLYLKRFYEQESFQEMARPDKNMSLIYSKLAETDCDIIIEGNLEYKNVAICHGKDLPNGDFNIYSIAQANLSQNGEIIDVNPVPGNGLPKLSFAMTFWDNKLSLGICTNDHDVATETISGFASSNNINIHSTPEDIREFVERVFVPSD